MKAVWRRFILFIFIFVLNFGCANKITRISAPEITEIKTHLFLGQDYQEKNPKWQKEIAAAVMEANNIFLKEKIPVSLKIVEIDTVTVSSDFLEKISTGNDPITELSDYFCKTYFVRKPLPPKDIAVSVIQKQSNILFGVAYFPETLPHVAVLSRPENSKCGNNDCFLYFVSLFMHEVGHLLNAEDLYEEKEVNFLMYSRMDFDWPPQFLIDDKNRSRIREALKKYYQ